LTPLVWLPSRFLEDPSMHDDRKLIENRLRRAMRDRIKPALYGARAPLTVQVWHAPGEPVDFADAVANDFVPSQVGEKWGRAWATSWFRFTGQVPADFDGKPAEVLIDLWHSGDGPGFSAEGLAYTLDGQPLKALNPFNGYLPIAGCYTGADAVDPTSPDALGMGGINGKPSANAKGGATVDFYVEAAANPTIMENGFNPTQRGDWDTAGDRLMYELHAADIALVNVDVYELYHDLEVLGGLMAELPLELPRRWEILTAIGSALDALDYADVPATAAAARAELADVLAKPAYASAHQISGVGHAHIDSAWLWPLRETVRKVARTVSNVTALAADNPGFVFAFSSAQQHAWMKEHKPKVWAKLKQAVADGVIIPVGGMWVESDTNMPGGEAMARQFVHGKRFFLEEYGIETDEAWLPDSFGYSGALPQIVRLSNTSNFLTQKISWNQTNKFPHHTFSWEGIDGTRVFTHFPSADTYNGSFSAKELAYAASNYQDKGSGNRSLLPFGYGDGGGGPSREMLARAKRTADLEGSTKVTIERQDEFFAKARADLPEPAVWAGELYLELHRGTYTSQAKTKQGNRRSESLLREAELWCTAAMLAGKADYPYADMDRLWKVVLLHQFHDILPGSSIHWVHREAEETYAKVAAELENIIGSAQRALAGEGDKQLVFNATPHVRDGVPAMGAAVATPAATPSTIDVKGECFVLDNGLVRAIVDENGLLISVVDLDANREALSGPANLLQLHPDTPNLWDAWDVDKFYRNKVTDLTGTDSIDVVDDTLVVTRSFGSSTVKQTISVPAGSKRVEVSTTVDWHETEKFLKVAFPLDIRAERSAAETQFGHVFRPTHTNTSWEAAKFEVCAHRFVHVEEPGFGAAVVNDSTYGHDITRDTDDDGVTTTTIRLSLLRAPRFPDPVTDQGEHTLRYALVVGADVIDAVAEGFRINLPARTVTGGNEVAPLVSVDNPNVVVSAVKPADDESGDIVVRVYEAAGGRANAVLDPGFSVTAVHETDLLERPTEERTLVDGTVELALRPFQILTLRFTR